MKSLSKQIEEKLAELESDEDLEEGNVTGNLDGGEGPIKTPYAFRGKSKKDKKAWYKNAVKDTGYSVVRDIEERKNMSTYKKMMDVIHLNEINYKSYKADESMSSKGKVNTSIKEINKKLYEIERTVNQNIKLKTETGVNSTQYWKSTKYKLGKISERMNRISIKLKELGS